MGCKVDTIIERYALSVPGSDYASVDDYLVARWTGTDGRSAEGYKSLTEWFNKRLLKRRYERLGRETMGIHLDHEYDVIVGDETIKRDELAVDLEADDISIDDLAREFVSWSTMRHHLKGCLEAQKDAPQAETNWEVNTVQQAQEQTAAKTRSVLSSLASKARLPDAERTDVHVQVKLACPECSVRVPFEEAVERGYVCETHFEAESEQPSRARWKTSLSAIATSYSVLELAQSAVLESAPLFETLPAAL